MSDTNLQDKDKQNDEALFKTYIDTRKVMIVDPSVGIRAGIARIFVDLGAKTANIKLCSTYTAAEADMATFQPDIVICEFDLGPTCGLALLQRQRETRPESMKSIFILVTKNSSQSAVAQAAEEDIDSFIMKPYTPETLCKAIVRAVVAKEYPSTYYRKIEEGKTALFKGDLDNALATFEKAKELDPKPTLACFYHGQTFLIKQSLDPARGSFNLGLTYNKIHYKCLVGLFDALQKENMHSDAYDVVRKIVRYFPANPKRLAEVLRLAVVTNNFEDIERYYQAFTEIEARSEDLLRYICAALVTCGKFYLRNKSRNRALVLFEKASLYSSERPYILREIMVSLLTDGMQKEAASFLKLFSTTTHSSPEYLAMKYIVYDDRTLVPESSIIEGERLLDRGIQYPEIYRTLIVRCIQMKHPEKAKRMFEEACYLFPETEPAFWNIPMFQIEPVDRAEVEEEITGKIEVSGKKAA